MSWLLLPLCLLCTTGSQVFFRMGARRESAGTPGGGPAGLRTLILNAYTGGGVLLYVAFSLSWLLVLSQMPLTLAYPILSLDTVGVAAASWWILGEPVPPRKWIGIAFITLGAALVGGT